MSTGYQIKVSVLVKDDNSRAVYANHDFSVYHKGAVEVEDELREQQGLDIRREIVNHMLMELGRQLSKDSKMITEQVFAAKKKVENASGNSSGQERTSTF